MTTTYVATPEEAGRRLDHVLAEWTGHTRSWCQQRIKERRVSIGEIAAKANYTLKNGDRVLISLPDTNRLPAPQLNIVYEDSDLIVVDKPAGVLAHASYGVQRSPNVAEFARSRVTDSDPERPGIVHRLDRDTSGLMLLAKHPTSKQYLQELFRAHQVKKTYLALVVGRLKLKTAKVELPLGRSQRSRAKQAPQPSGRPAVTTYTVMSEYPGASLVELQPQTGRTHQIRVHMAAIGHPIIGDAFYGRPAVGLGRHFLHAARLSFVSPSGQRLELESPLPLELSTYLSKLTKPV